MNMAEIFLTMVNRSITAGIVILVVLAVRALLGRFAVPRRYIYLLWLIPALRLLCPVTLSSVTSLFNLPVFDRAVQTEAGLDYLPEELAELAQSREQSDAEPGGVQSGAYGMGIVRRDIGEQANYYGGQAFELSSQCPGREGGSNNLRAADIANPVDWGRMALYGLTGVWLAGAMVLAFRQLYAYDRIRRQVACAVRLEGESGGNVYECENISTPFTMGPLHARIYIPCHMAGKEREYVLLHERYHIRCRDLWVRLLACVLQVAYWYNPLIWVAVRCMERDMEMRCDEYVLEQMGDEIRYDYSLSLLSYAAGRRYQPLDVTAFGESGTGKRVSHVLKYKKTGICIIVLAVAAILAVSAVCLTDREPREEQLPEETDFVEKKYFWGQQELQIRLAQDTAPAMSLAGRSVVPLPSTAEAGDYGDSIRCVGEHCFFLVRPLYAGDAVSYEMQVFDGDRKEWNCGIAGGGPDLFYIDTKDLPALWEKGVLMDLRELVSQESLDQIYPGLLATGTINGSLAGVSNFYNIRTLVTSRDTWPGEEWTLEEMVALLEAGEYPHAVNRGFGYDGGSALLYILACRDMSHSPFVDWETGTCSFDSDLFIRLLEAVKQYPYYTDMEASTELTPFQDLLNGNCLAVEDSVCDLRDFVRIKQFMGEQYSRPGIPGADSSYQLVDPIGFIVVNKNCKNKEAAAAYLEFLLSARVMGDYRRDCRDTFKVSRDYEGKWAVSRQDMSGQYYLYYLLDKNDPALLDDEMPEIYVEYLECCEDYYAYMESLTGQPPMDSQIADIIQEEAESFFEGNQSAEHVADVIQNRVKLYLAEMQ